MSRHGLQACGACCRMWNHICTWHQASLLSSCNSSIGCGHPGKAWQLLLREGQFQQGFPQRFSRRQRAFQRVRRAHSLLGRSEGEGVTKRPLCYSRNSIGFSSWSKKSTYCRWLDFQRTIGIRGSICWRIVGYCSSIWFGSGEYLLIVEFIRVW